MKSSFDILSGLFQVIKPVVGDSITGQVYLIDEPNGDQKENISINLLANPIDYVQSATLNVNLHVMGINEHQPNLARMRELANLVYPLLDDAKHNQNGIDLYCEIEDDKGVLKDQDQAGKYLYNIRVKCITL